ncbi:MAG TPA: hypothetical protein VG318_09830 [Actinomycetota bacterium]|nr:hypothetical protein [Actinomycetota bacterium]
MARGGLRGAGARLLELAGRRGTRRVAWGLSDQAVSSLTNFALGVVIARQVAPREFGAFSLAFSTYLIVLGVTRAVALEPLSVRFAQWVPEQRRLFVSRAVGTALAMGGVAGVATLLTAFAFDEPLRGVLVALALGLPLLMAQDAWRYVFVASGRPASALTNDAVWAAVLFPGFALISAAAGGSAAWYVGVWCLSAGVAAGVGVLQSATIPKVRGAPAWWRANKDLGTRYLGEFTLSSGASYVTAYFVAAAAGVAAAGALRGAQILLGPAALVHLGIGLLVVPELSRIYHGRSSEHLLRASSAVSGGLFAITATWSVALVLIPAGVGRALLGESWTIAEPVMLPMGLGLAASGATMGASGGLRALAAADEGLRARLVVSIATVVAGTTGAVLGGAEGAAWGSSAALAAGTMVWWNAYLKALRRRPSPRQVPASPS